jgi:hypothetical protein
MIKRQGHSGEGLRAKEFFIWIRCNPLKSPDSAKGIQGNPSLFVWFSLDLLGFIWRHAALTAGPLRPPPAP